MTQKESKNDGVRDQSNGNPIEMVNAHRSRCAGVGLAPSVIAMDIHLSPTVRVTVSDGTRGG